MALVCLFFLRSAESETARCARRRTVGRGSEEPDRTDRLIRRQCVADDDYTTVADLDSLLPSDTQKTVGSGNNFITMLLSF